MLDVSDLFDNSFYLANNPDVANGVARGDFSSGLQHFELFGQFERRDPSAFFDASFYQAQYPDIADAVSQGLVVSEFQHFLSAGQLEGRDPVAEFDTAYYLQQNPDVAAIVPDQFTAYEHFLEAGQEEGRNPIATFNSNFYLQQYPDVADGVNSGVLSSAFAHFVQFGLTEGRLRMLPMDKDNFSTALELGTLSGDRTLSDSVGAADPADIYRFTLGAASNINLRLDGLAADADLEVMRDLNGNGIAENQDLVAASVELATATDSLGVSLGAGTYYIRVSHVPFIPQIPLAGQTFAPIPNADTNYNLNISVA
ncbi:MAG TPA: PPC domain-containing protein [Oscillatoriaceae cyanobacterium M33_DOE_052]|uniref:Calcium-binding protein n=1 Tax=Planktothricoides sp. SpSt-374 TaxID=2282167 RepID=A0A7C3ZNT1_9CYAN|nr:PPC domain-containing protein [Oscillatoriaceae cyanobacterium M33_DOE_052]